ncbi:MAG: universal stress protein [Haloarcula sp.]
MYENILFPTDGSDGAATALDHARDIAESYDAALHVLNVVDTSSPHIGMTVKDVEELTPGMIGEERDEVEPGMVGEEHDLSETVLERSRALVERAASEVDSVDVVTVVEQGTPHRAILDYAAENDIDLVVMGTHGRTGIERYLLGSVAEKVVRTSEVPVLTVRLGEDEEQ